MKYLLANKLTVIGLSLISLIIVTGLIADSIKTDGSNPNEESRRREQIAREAAESQATQYARNAVLQCIDEQVRHTTSFVDTRTSVRGEDRITTTGGARWVFSGAVQVTNVFGASIRQPYSIEVEQPSTTTGAWSVVSLTIAGRQVLP